MRRLLPLLASFVLLALPSAAQAYTFYEWTADGGPTGIAQAGAGPLTVTFSSPAAIGQIGLGGVQSAPVAVSGGTAEPRTLALGPGDGNLWFVDPVNGRVGRTDPGLGPTLLATVVGGGPADLVASDNNLMWVVESVSGELDCITPAGVVTAKASGLAHPEAIARGNDGALWYVDSAANQVARLARPANCSAAISPVVFTLPPGAAPTDVTAAPSGNDVYITGTGGLQTITPAGVATPVDIGTTVPFVLHSNASGVWWVANGQRIGRLLDGVTTEWALPRGSATPIDFTLASDNALWYTGTGNTIGRFSEETGATGPVGETGAQGPTGSQGPSGAQGPTGAQGPAGTQGPTGAQGPAGAAGGQGAKGDPGQQGPAGEQGPQGATPLASPGAIGPQGPAGARGATGATGAAGPRGQRGKTGPAATIPKISCKLSGTKVTCKVAKGGSGGSGGNGNTGGGEGLRLRLSRSSKLYATGSRAAKSTRTTVRLHALRKLKAGKYTLAVDLGEDVTVRVPLRLG